jgi:hypothetical protein
MRSTSPRISALLLAPLVAAALCACGDTRLDKLTVGISKDSVTSVMGSLPHTTETYFVNSKTWELDLFTRHPTLPADSVPWRKMSPVILANGKVVGWGWSWWSKQAARLNLPMPQ